MSERKSIHDGWTPEPQEQVQPGDPWRSPAFDVPLREAARGVLPEVMDAEIGDVIGVDVQEGLRRVRAKAARWTALRAALTADKPDEGLDVEEAVAALVDAIEGQNLYHGRYGTTPAGSATARAIWSCLRNHHGLTLARLAREETEEVKP